MTVYHVWSHLLNELFPLSFVTIHVFSVGDRIYPRRQSPASVVRTGTAVLNLWAYWVVGGIFAWELEPILSPKRSILFLVQGHGHGQ